MENSGVCTTYISEGHSDGDGDGTEEHDDTQREQDALTGCDIDLQQEGALIWLFFSLWSFTTEFFLFFFFTLLWKLKMVTERQTMAVIPTHSSTDLVL